MAVSRSVSVVLSAKVNQFKADMAAAGKSAVDAARETETAWDKSATGAGKAMASIGRYEQEMTTAGTATATFGGVVVGSLGLATRATMSWESAWTGVLKTVDGTPRQLAAVEKGLRGLAKTLPASHEEIAAVAEAAGQLGIKTSNVVAFTKTMIDMGESTNLSAEEAATSLARLANIMGTSQKKFGNMGAAIVGLGNNFATTEREIVDMSMRVAAVGKQSGLTEGQVFGLATALSSVGIEAEAGGTAISMVMKKITNEVGTGGDKLDEFARIAGMSSEQFATAWQNDAAGALNAFIAGLGRADASGENVNQTLSALGITGIRESDSLLRLAGASDVLSNALKQGNVEFDKGTALAEEAAKRYETAESRMRMSANTIKDTAITIGGTFAPVVAGAMETLGGFVDLVGSIPEPVLKMGAAVAGIAGAAALGVGGIMLIIPKLAETVTAFGTLKTAAKSSDGALSGVAAVAGKTSGAIRGLVQAAGTAMAVVAVFTAIDAAANKMTSKTMPGLAQINSDLIALAQNGETLNGAFGGGNAFTDWLGGSQAVNNMADALEVVGRHADDGTAGIARFREAIKPGRQELEKASEGITAYDEGLASLATGGNAEMAQAAFAKIAADAEAQGRSVTFAAEQFPAYKAALQETANQLGVTGLKDEEYANWMRGELPAAVATAVAANEENAAGLVGVGDAAQDASGGLKSMLDSLLALGIIQQSEMEAMASYEAAIDEVSKAVSENGRTLDITTEAGRANQDVLFGIADAGRDAANSMAENGASQEQVQGQLQRTYDDLVSTAGKFGLNAKEAENMARKVLGIPDNVTVETWMSDAAEEKAKDTKVAADDIPKNVKVNVDADTKDADDDLAAVKEKVEKLPNKTIWVTIKEAWESIWKPPKDEKVRKTGGGRKGVEDRARMLKDPFAQHDGNILTPMAAGGFTGAEMVPPNTWRVVGDRMDVDEAYVPLDGSRRSWEILLEALNRMPGAIPMAKGGIASAQKQVDSANDRLRDARRMKSDAKSARAKAIAERRVRSAEDELATAKRSLKSAKDREKSEEKAAKLAADRAKEEQARRERVSGLQSDLRTDLRRGSIRDQVTGGLSGGYSAVDRLYGLGGNQDLSRGSRSRANSSARKFEANLRNLYSQAERIDAKLKAAQDKAQELKGIKSSVVNSLLNGRDLDVGTFSTNVGGKWVTGSNLGQAAKSLRVDVGAMKAFAGKLKKLVQLGVPGAIVQEIAQAGVVEGSNMADSFIDATAADRKSYLGAWAEYEQYANQAGQYVTEGFYKGGSAAADGVVRGLEGKKKNVETAIANLAKVMESTFKSVLGIRSPSTVMAELGGFTAEGLVQGMLGGVSDVQSAAAMLGAAAVPAMGPVSMDVGVSPVVADDEGLAGLAMQDMSATTLDAMSTMQSAVAEGWAGMLSQTQAAQAGMLTDTQAKQTGMLSATQSSQQSMLAQTQAQQSGMLATTQQSQLGMLTNVQAQQEQMRATIAAKQLGSRTALTSEQEAMRAVMADKQGQMRAQNLTDFESMRLTTSQKLRDMRTNADGTMIGFRADYGAHLGSMKASNREAFGAMSSASNAAFDAIRAGMNAEMRGARPELGTNLNRLIAVFASFTAEVNKAFGDVGVKLKAPNALKFESGGVMPGYTPGRDVHEFYSPTAGNLYLSGGEAIMRPEWTRAMGGEAGVKAQNDAARQGRLDDLLHMQTGGGAFVSGGVYGPVPGVNAFADSGVWRGLYGIVKKQFPSARLNSGYRGGSTTVSGNRSLHSGGYAVDLGGPLQQIFDFLYNNYRNSSEIIYSPANGRQIKNGRPYTYSGAVRAIHWNHVHWANRSVPAGGAADMTPGAFGDEFMPMSHPFLDRAGVSAGSDLSASYGLAAQKLTQQIYAKHAKLLPSGVAGQLGKGIMSQVSEGLVGKAKEFGKTAGASGADFSNVANGPVKQMAKQMLEAMGWGDQWGDLNWLVNKESSWNPNAQNPTSTAYGLFQFLNGTWGTVGGQKTSDPRKQIEYGLKYIKQRYGDVRGARRFWERNNWYEGGTRAARRGLAVVGENGPELVNFAGGEQVMSNPDSMRFMAENRMYVPTQRGMQFDQAAFTRAVADAVTANGVSPESIAAAMNGVRFTLKAGQHEFDAAVVTAVGTGYDQSVSRRSKSSQKIGAI
ncbi:phage tail tape measure protein [Brevibacterium casei]|uniref:Phage tail tape measure protein, TP901 family, core region n=1 Tax=Brevibacterium casei CIP 102111 TaxID=1255625 RepID=A0A2H1IW31_9MICO|nr:phage tail tape measure protein [Brevibacterium casei]QPR39598.1 phage tail tape measure protein [Brevibacterium casei]QPR43762.1 phage tail tape measure protein [Brevibacterium casei]SMX79437.1 phage tail tape measure protein, TP901 family, core region [Brevibacterium casei CIP 102111]